MAPGLEIPAKIKDALAANPQGLSITDIVQKTKINRNTAGRYLDKLLVSGQVEMRHFGMAKIYALAHRVPVSAVLSISSEYIMQLSGSLRIVFINEAFAQLLDTPAAELTGKNIEYTPFVMVFDDTFDRFIGHVKDGLEGTEWSGEFAPAHLNRIFSGRIAPTALDNGQKGVSVILEDITEKKQADERLLESEQRYRILAESSNDLIFMIASDDRVEYVNTFAAGTLNKKPEELIGRVRGELFPEPVASRQKEMLDRVFLTGTPSSDESPLPLHGELRWYDHCLMPVFDREGAVRSVFGVSRDITKSRQAHEALMISEEKFRRIFEDGPLGMSIIGPDTRFTLVNRRFCDMLGYTKEELLGRSFADVTHPSWVSTNRENIDRIYAGKIPFVHEEKQYLRKDRAPLWVSVTVTPLRDSRGQVISTISIVEDIGERKKAEAQLVESERRFRDFADLLPQSVWECDSAGNLTFVNQSSFAMYRYAPADMEKGLSIWQMMSPADLPWLLDLVKDAVTKPREQFPSMVEYTALRGDGSTFPIRIYLSPVVRGDRIEGMRGIGIDLTEERQAEEALRETGAKFQAIFDSTFQFTALLAPDGTVLEVNRTALTFIGKKREECAGRPFWETGWWQDDNGRIRRLRDAMGRAAAGSFVRYEETLKGAGWDDLIVDFSLTPVRGPDGDVRLIIAEARDITGRRRTEDLLKESEEKFRRVFEDGPLGMAIVSPEHRFVSVNRRCQEIFGYTEEELLKKTIDDVTLPEQQGDDAVEMQKIYEGKSTQYRTKKRYVKKDGSVILASLTVSPLRDGTGKITSTLGIVEEIPGQERSGTGQEN
jgi:PAS domain S-box-containing protein